MGEASDAAVAELRRLAATGSQNELQPIGVPPGFTAERHPGVPYARDAVAQVPPRYFDGDEWLPATSGSVAIAELQRRLVAAGLIPRGAEYRVGYWDDVSRGAYRQLLAESNGSGLGAGQQLRVRASAAQEERAEKFKAPARLKADPAKLRQHARDLMTDVIGPDREPTSDELKHLVGVLQSYDQQAHDVDVAGARAEFDAETAAGQGGAYVAPTVQDVDPSARFEEYLRDRYRPEMEMREGTADMAAGRENLMGNIFALDQMIGA